MSQPKFKRRRSRPGPGSSRAMSSISRLTDSVDLPPIIIGPIGASRMRYSLQSAGNFTAAELLSIVAVGAGGGTSTTLYGAIRIRKIEIWTTTSANPNYGIQWNTGAGTIGAPTSIKFDTAVTTAYAGHASYKPPVGSFADMWHSAIGDTTPVFYLFANTGTTIDISYEYTLNFTQTPNTAVGLNAPAPAGELGYSSFSARLLPSAPTSAINVC